MALMPFFSSSSSVSAGVVAFRTGWVSASGASALRQRLHGPGGWWPYPSSSAAHSNWPPPRRLAPSASS
eukprot:CAMPEP_0119534780 /NCGR_PEP_ID=MMETSP1344-20130328/47952_1 /TAXON_ID=236787 /ORGANISM="Florenciella parvula, Strain CCMP2471" /LENGTH=68 /DNA_ID=CAMNT_0007576151 /DNA_START=25 /DNA_END=227 /DNA_ORIENTATION=-